MLTLYIAVILQNGDIKETLGKGVYNTPQACYIATQWPKVSDSTEDYKCIKASGEFVNLKVVEEK